MKLRTAGIIAAGVAGLVIAALLGFLALQLVSQPVGLSSIPTRAGDQLVSERTKQRAERKKRADRAAKERHEAAERAEKGASDDDSYSGESGGDDSSGRDDSGNSGSDHSGSDDSGSDDSGRGEDDGDHDD